MTRRQKIATVATILTLIAVATAGVLLHARDRMPAAQDMRRPITFPISIGEEGRATWIVHEAVLTSDGPGTHDYRILLSAEASYLEPFSILDLAGHGRKPRRECEISRQQFTLVDLADLTRESTRLDCHSETRRVTDLRMLHFRTRAAFTKPALRFDIESEASLVRLVPEEFQGWLRGFFSPESGRLLPVDMTKPGGPMAVFLSEILKEAPELLDFAEEASDVLLAMKALEFVRAPYSEPPGPGGLAILIRALSAGDPEIRASALRRLSHRSDPDLVERLVGALNDSASRASAFTLLAESRQMREKARPSLLATLSSFPDEPPDEKLSLVRIFAGSGGFSMHQDCESGRVALEWAISFLFRVLESKPELSSEIASAFEALVRGADRPGWEIARKMAIPEFQRLATLHPEVTPIGRATREIYARLEAASLESYGVDMPRLRGR